MLRATDPGPAVVLITGVMASGKSTVAQALAERLPRSVHVRGDVFRRMVVSGRAEMVPGAYEEAAAQLRLRYRLSAMTADAYAGEGWTAVVQDVVLGEELTRYVELVRTRPLYVVVLAPEPQAVAEREARRGRAVTGPGGRWSRWTGCCGRRRRGSGSGWTRRGRPWRSRWTRCSRGSTGRGWRFRGRLILNFLFADSRRRADRRTCGNGCPFVAGQPFRPFEAVTGFEPV